MSILCEMVSACFPGAFLLVTVCHWDLTQASLRSPCPTEHSVEDKEFTTEYSGAALSIRVNNIGGIMAPNCIFMYVKSLWNSFIEVEGFLSR